jgi:ABC-2 type transport system permease protein
MNAALRIMLKDLRRRARAPLAPLVMLAFPFVFAGLIALAFGGGGESAAPRFRVALVDEDGGLVGRLVGGAFTNQQTAKFLEAVPVDLPHAMRLIEHNRAGGAIVIPAGFSDSLLAGRSASLRVIRNPASAIGGQATEETAAFLALLLEGATDVLAEPLARIRAMARGDWAPDASVAEIAVEVSRSLQPVRRFVFPPAIYLRKPAEPAAVPAGSNFLPIFRNVLPGMATFALFFLATGLMADLFRERERGTLGRQLTSPVRAASVVVGKILATMAIGAIVAAAMAALGGLLLGVRADPGAFALLSLAFLLAVTGFVTLLYSFARNERQGGTLNSIALMVMAFLGGSFIPLDALPSFVRGIAPVTLNYWAIRGFRALLEPGSGAGAIVLPAAVLLAAGAASVLAGGAVLQRRLMRGA